MRSSIASGPQIAVLFTNSMLELATHLLGRYIVAKHLLPGDSAVDPGTTGDVSLTAAQQRRL